MARITKTVRLSGDAPNSIEDAITTVLGRAALTIDDIRSFRVVDITGQVDEAGVPAGYRVTLDITFVVRSGDEPI
jgi:flavin-binding protein dodecin